MSDNNPSIQAAGAPGDVTDVTPRGALPRLTQTLGERVLAAPGDLPEPRRTRWSLRLMWSSL